MKRLLFVLSLFCLISLFGCNAAMRANMKFDNKNYKEAVALYEEHLYENPVDVSARARLAYAYYQMGRMNDALKETESILQNYNGNSIDNLYLGEILVASGDFQRASERYAQYRNKGNPQSQNRAKFIAALLRNLVYRQEARKAIEDEKKGSYPKRVPNRVVWTYYRDTSADGKSMTPYRKALTDAFIRMSAASDTDLDVVSRERMQAYVAEMGLSDDNGVSPSQAYRLMSLTGASHVIYGNLGMGSPVKGKFTKESYRDSMLPILLAFHYDREADKKIDATIKNSVFPDFAKAVIKAAVEERRRIDAKIDAYKSSKAYKEYEEGMAKKREFNAYGGLILKLSKDIQLISRKSEKDRIDSAKETRALLWKEEAALLEAQQRPLRPLEKQREELWLKLYEFLLQYAPSEIIAESKIEDNPLDEFPQWGSTTIVELFNTPVGETGAKAPFPSTEHSKLPFSEKLAEKSEQLYRMDKLVDLFSYSRTDEDYTKQVAAFIDEMTKQVKSPEKKPEQDEEKGGGGNGGSCFAPDTLVLMADGAVRQIIDIRVGDKVKAYDESKGMVVDAVVIGTKQGETGRYYLINNSIKVAPPHPFYTADNQWIRIKDLKGGETVRISSSFSKIKSIEVVNNIQKIYNIIIKDHHNFFVSGSGTEFFLVKEGSE